jgi:hypothetical protein
VKNPSATDFRIHTWTSDEFHSFQRSRKHPQAGEERNREFTLLSGNIKYSFRIG